MRCYQSPVFTSSVCRTGAPVGRGQGAGAGPSRAGRVTSGSVPPGGPVPVPTRLGSPPRRRPGGQVLRQRRRNRALGQVRDAASRGPAAGLVWVTICSGMNVRARGN